MQPDEFVVTEHDPGDTNQDQDWISSPIVVRTDKTLVVKDKFLATDNEVQMLLGQRINRKAIQANYTLAAMDYLVGVTSLVNTISVGLPNPAVASIGKAYIIKDEVGGASTTAITVKSDAEKTIDGATSLSINTNYASYCFYSDGANWFIDKNYLSNANPASPVDFYGDGSDGAVVLNGSTTYSFLTLVGSTYTMQRDTYFTDVTINTNIFLNPAGYSIFINGTLTRAGTGMIIFTGGNGGAGTTGLDASGSSGTSGVSAPGGIGAVALNAGTLPASPAGQDGGTGGGTGASTSNNGASGNSGASSINGLGVDGVAGVIGGNGGNASFIGATGGAGGTAGSAAATLLAPHDYTPLRLLANWISGSWIRYGANGGSGGGGGGGGGSRNSSGPTGGGGGGGGGGSGAAGGFIAAYIRAIVAANTNVLFQANGGNGGSAGNGGSGHSSTNSAGGGGGSGGSGGSGGVVVLIYGSSDKTVTSLIQVNAGAGGSKGTGGASGGAGTNAGDDGTAGLPGLAGTSYILKI